MAKITTKISLTEKDLNEILAENYNLDPKTSVLNIYKYNGDSREPSYTNITIEGNLRGQKILKTYETP